MSLNLLEEFFAQECTPHVRHLLEKALAAAAPPGQRFEFNRFEITIDRDAGTILIEDVLDATDAGALRVPLEEFVAALRRPTRP
jgi:hypothetical protein